MKPITIPLSVSRVFLLPCEGGYLQVDAGYEHDYPLYRKNLAKAGIPLDRVRYLFLTHHHDDHAGFLNELARDANLTIIAHQQAAALLQSGQNDKTRGGGYVNSFIKLAAGIKMRFDPRWTLAFPPFNLRANDILLAGDDTQVLRCLGMEGQALYTPGHSIDHLTLLLDSGEAFCGDAAASFLLWAGTHYCTVFMTDMDEYLRPARSNLFRALPELELPAKFNGKSVRQMIQRIPSVRRRTLVARAFEKAMVTASISRHQ